MRAGFLGTPASAVPSLAALVDIADVALVITQPDRPRGRSKTPVPPPIKIAAGEWGLRVAQPATHEELRRALHDAALDLAVVVAYGRILRPDTLATAPLGFVNVHFSLLPRWRGAAPVERAILAGDDRTGVTLMKIDEGMDTGPLLGMRETRIDPAETAGELTARLAHDGAVMLDDVLPLYARGKVDPAPQIEAGATHAARLTTAEAQVTATMSAAHAHRTVRAYTPRPGAWCVIDGVRTKLWAVSSGEAVLPPGRIEIAAGTPLLGLREGTLVLDRLQPAGKRVLTGEEWANGRHGAPGALTDE